MHLVELCSTRSAPAPWPGSGSLSRSHSLQALGEALEHADCVLAHHEAPELVKLMATTSLPLVVYAEQPSAAQAVSLMRAGASDVVPAGLAWGACLAAKARRAGDPNSAELLTLSHTQALEQERLELIGQLSWGLAHELLNPATFVMANLEETRACIRDLQPLLSYGVDLAVLHGNPAQLEAFKRQANWPQAFGELDELIDECQQGMARINNLVNDIKAYGPTDQAERSVDLRRLLQRVLGLARKELQVLRVDAEIERVDPVHASPARLASLLSSLLGAILKRPVQSLERVLSIRCTTHSPWVELHLHDSAPLRPDEDSVELARTQLGVAFGRELVARLGGELSIQGGPEGLRVRLRLPSELPQRRQAADQGCTSTVVVQGLSTGHASRAADVLRCKTLHVLEPWPPPSWLRADLALVREPGPPLQDASGREIPRLLISEGVFPLEEMAQALAKSPKD